MKKILTFLMVGTLMICCPIANVFAEEVPNETEINNIVDSSEGSVLLTATKASSYSVQLPIKVDVSSGTGTITIKAKGDVDSAFEISVTEKADATNKLVDKADENNTVDITVTPGSAISGALVTSSYTDTAKTEIGIAHNGLTAGSYSYNFPIVISLQKITQ